MTIRTKDLPPAMRKRLGAKATPSIRQARRGVMNATEAAYAEYLERAKRFNTVLFYQFEPMTLRLPGGVKYTPDFLIQFGDSPNGPQCLECHEVKGRHRDGGIVRLKVAAGAFPCFNFKLVEKRGDGWDETELASE